MSVKYYIEPYGYYKWIDPKSYCSESRWFTFLIKFSYYVWTIFYIVIGVKFTFKSEEIHYIIRENSIKYSFDLKLHRNIIIKFLDRIDLKQTIGIIYNYMIQNYLRSNYWYFINIIILY